MRGRHSASRPPGKSDYSIRSITTCAPDGKSITTVAGVAVGLLFGLLPPGRLLSLDPENFTVRSFIIDGITRGVGISIFTILLMGLVATVEASGMLRRVIDLSTRSARSVRSAEFWIVSVVGVTVLLTTHSIVAILIVAEFARRTGERFRIHRYRRANLLNLTVSTFPFLLPYFIPVILTAGTTGSAAPLGVGSISPLYVGLYNFHSWAVLLVVIFAVVTGYGRRFAADQSAELGPPVSVGAAVDARGGADLLR